MIERNRAIGAMVIVAAGLFGYAVTSRPGSTAHRLVRDCGELRWNSPRRPTVLLIDSSALPSAPVLVVASALWSDGIGAEDLRVETSTSAVADFRAMSDAFARGEGDGPIGSVLVVSGAEASRASPITEGTEDGEMAARLWWTPQCGIAFGVLKVPDLSVLSQEEAIIAALHGLGHVLGLAHSDDPASVMAAKRIPSDPNAACDARAEDPTAVCVAQGITPDDATMARGAR